MIRKPTGPTWSVLTLALIATFFAACAFPEEGFDGDLEGEYYINGFDHQGTEYGGSLTISTADESGTYEMQWIITGSIQTGTGVLSGNQLTAEWDAVEGYDTASRGTAVYEITDDGELIGERRVQGQPGTGTEEAFPIR